MQNETIQKVASEVKEVRNVFQEILFALGVGATLLWPFFAQ